jgi:hypothetical protein
MGLLTYVRLGRGVLICVLCFCIPLKKRQSTVALNKSGHPFAKGWQRARERNREGSSGAALTRGMVLLLFGHCFRTIHNTTLLRRQY